MIEMENDEQSLREECPNCGKPSIRTVRETQTVAYGRGKDSIEIPVQLPVRTCTQCGFQYTDEQAEDIRHDAICHHLGLMTPGEIAALRRRHNMTRSEFAELTGFGEASLARWETGKLIQNAANNQFLYLLSFESNMEHLRNRRVQKKEERAEAAEAATYEVRFSHLTDVNSVQLQADSFSLRRSLVM